MQKLLLDVCQEVLFVRRQLLHVQNLLADIRKLLLLLHLAQLLKAMLLAQKKDNLAAGLTLLLISGNPQHINAKKLRCLGKLDISGEQGQMGRAACRQMKSVKGTQRRTELCNPSSSHCIVMLLNFQNSIQVFLEEMLLKLADDLLALFPRHALPNFSGHSRDQFKPSKKTDRWSLHR